VDFAAAEVVMVLSICCPNKEIHKQTWRSPDGQTNNQCDVILIDKEIQVV
jgi:hypothetical protein